MENGFTLVEIIVVLIIIGILSTLALSQYIPGKERALGKEAIANLKLIAAAERIYRMETAFYYPYAGLGFASEGDIANINAKLKLSLPSERNWDYTIDTSGADTFTAIADRQGAGGYLDCQYSLAHNDADGEPDSSGRCP